MGWRLPLRSLWRNRRRTFLSLAVIALGTSVSVFVLGFLENSRVQIQDSTVQQFGNLQVASPLLWEDAADGYEYLISPADAAQLDALLAEDPAYPGQHATAPVPRTARCRQADAGRLGKRDRTGERCPRLLRPGRRGPRTSTERLGLGLRRPLAREETVPLRRRRRHADADDRRWGVQRKPVPYRRHLSLLERAVRAAGRLRPAGLRTASAQHRRRRPGCRRARLDRLNEPRTRSPRRRASPAPDSRSSRGRGTSCRPSTSSSRPTSTPCSVF